MSKNFFAVLTSAILLATISPVLHAQGSDLGQIRGTVTDASEAAVPNAKVTATDAATGASQTVNANSAGEYEIMNLKSGAYKISISAAGFNNLVLSGIQ